MAWRDQFGNFRPPGWFWGVVFIGGGVVVLLILFVLYVQDCDVFTRGLPECREGFIGWLKIIFAGIHAS